MPDPSSSVVLYEVVDSHIAVVTLNRPEVRNAVNGAVAQALELAVKRVESDPDIRVAILASSLATVFCAGADLAEVAAGNRAGLRTSDGGFAGFVNAKRTKPWIAAVRGAAFAGGCEIAIACDMIVASEDARFGVPEVKRGLLAGAGGLHRLPQILPRNIAIEMIATGRPIDAQRAHLHGLVNQVAPLGSTLDAALELAREIAGNAPLSVAGSLEVVQRVFEIDEEELLALTAQVSARVASSEDSREGPRAFLEKRPARWTGR